MFGFLRLIALLFCFAFVCVWVVDFVLAFNGLLPVAGLCVIDLGLYVCLTVWFLDLFSYLDLNAVFGVYY